MAVGDEDIQKLFDMVERIARSVDLVRLTRSPFHLARCGGCGGPAWQQPCALCGHYPMGRPDPRPACSKDRFVAVVRGSAPNGEGNVATWALKHILKDRMPEGVSAWEGLPSPETVFDAIATENRVATRQRVDRVTEKAWSIAFEIGAAIERLPEVQAVPLAMDFRRKVGGIVADIHAGEVDWESAADILEEQARAVRRQVEISRSGYMHPLVHDFDQLRGLSAEKAAEGASPAP